MEPLQNILYKEIVIKDGEKGHTYGSIFGLAFDDSVTEVIVEDPHIKNRNQVANFCDFLEVVISQCESLEKVILRTTKHVKRVKAQEQMLIKAYEIAEDFGIGVDIDMVDGHLLHDRQIIFDNGWKVKSGRGLDIYKYPIGPRSRMEDRTCRETTVDMMYFRDSSTYAQPKKFYCGKGCIMSRDQLYSALKMPKWNVDEDVDSDGDDEGNEEEEEGESKSELSEMLDSVFHSISPFPFVQVSNIRGPISNSFTTEVQVYLLKDNLCTSIAGLMEKFGLVYRINDYSLLVKSLALIKTMRKENGKSQWYHVTMSGKLLW